MTRIIRDERHDPSESLKNRQRIVADALVHRSSRQVIAPYFPGVSQPMSGDPASDADVKIARSELADDVLEMFDDTLVRPSILVATSAPLPAHVPQGIRLIGTAGTLPIMDGVTLTKDADLLVKDHLLAQYNGPYVVEQEMPWIIRRRGDHLQDGTQFWVARRDRTYALKTNDPVVIGTSPLDFVDTTGSGGSAGYQGSTTYVGASPTAIEMAVFLPAIGQFGHFAKGPTDKVYLVYRQASTVGALIDFSAVVMSNAAF